VPAHPAANAFEPRRISSCRIHVLLPGLVNAHTHAAMNLFRGIADDLRLDVWLEQHIWPRESRFVDEDFVYDGARLAAAEMLRGGVTCCNDMYFFPEASARAFLELGLRAMLGVAILDFPDRVRGRRRRLPGARPRVRDALKHEPTLSFSLAPHAPYTVGNATWEKIVVFARQLDLPVQTHLAETAREVSASRDAHGRSPLFAPARPRRDGPQFIAIHAVHSDDDDIALLAAQGLPRRPLSGVEHEAGMRHRARAASWSAASTWRSAPTARRRTIASTCSVKCAWPRCSRRRRPGTPPSGRRSRP
jgi:5-methylthioadenosine/S-adenosylhomocysteine deaminase